MSNTLDLKCGLTAPAYHYTPTDTLLLSAGPANCSPRVLRAAGHNILGIVHPEVFQMIEDIKVLLRYVFQTKNEFTFLQQTSGSGGIETAITNLLDPGEKILVAIGGLWGDRVVEMAKRYDLEVVTLKAPLGEVFTKDQLEEAIIKHKPQMLFVTHGESSHGTLQPLEGIGDICKRHHCLFGVDCVVSLGAEPFYTDRWLVDVAIAATQKAIGAPPGMALITLSPRAEEKMNNKEKPPPFYYDVKGLAVYWGFYNQPKKYYYSFNTSLLASTREALLQISEEGLENCWKRHKECAEKFCAGLKRIGFGMLIKKEELRLSTVTMATLPDGIQWPQLLSYLMKQYRIETGFGIGPTWNLAIRVGIMGYNARPEVVDYLLKALQESVEFHRSSSKPTDQRSEILQQQQVSC